MGAFFGVVDELFLAALRNGAVAGRGSASPKNRANLFLAERDQLADLGLHGGMPFGFIQSAQFLIVPVKEMGDDDPFLFAFPLDGEGFPG